ncbi:MAG: energy transducer TonB [Prevotellaceae bacterium]|jgi:protein TonB|nr:energy transducer TonB [Prevotellaceae bacterium]
MEVKKSPKADLENKRSMFVLIGFVMVFALMYIGFEWTQSIKKIEVAEDPFAAEEEEIIMNTTQDQPPPEVQAPPPAQVIQDVLTIVDDNIETEEPVIVSQDDDTPVEIPVVVQQPEEVIEEIFVVVETPPAFPGGDKARMEFLRKNMKYPTIAAETGIHGTVYVQFVVNKDGKIVDVTVVRGVHESLDKEAIRVVQLMPPWSPGKQQGKAVRTRFTLPIRFSLQ